MSAVDNRHRYVTIRVQIGDLHVMGVPCKTHGSVEKVLTRVVIKVPSVTCKKPWV